MCLSLHLTTFHFLPLKAISCTLQIVEVTTAQSIRAGRNGAEWYPGPQNCRHSWHLIRLLCVIVNQWLPVFFKEPIWCLPSLCQKGHSAQWVPLSASPSCSPGAAVQSLPAPMLPLHLLCSQNQFRQRRGGGGADSSWSSVYKEQMTYWLFFFSHAFGQYLVVLLVESQKQCKKSCCCHLSLFPHWDRRSLC